MASLRVELWFLVVFWLLVNLVRIALAKLIPSALGRLERVHGIAIGHMSITVHLKCFNQWINSFNPRRSLSKAQFNIYRQYFRLGILFAYLTFPFAIFTLIKSLIQSIEISPIITRFFALFQTEIELKSNFTIISNNDVIKIPGINISPHDMIYVIVACAITSAIHELGHAFAANRNRMQVENFGITLYICFPLTFVSLAPAESTKSSNRMLEVASAGILNNALLCLVAILMLLFNPLMFLYKPANGLLVTHVDPSSAIADGPYGLKPGGVIHSINGLPVSSISDWKQQLIQIANHQEGFCVLEKLMNQVTSSSLCNLAQCCKEDNKSLCFVGSTRTTTSNDCNDQCVQYLEKSNLNQYYRSLTESSTEQCPMAYCLAARAVLRDATQRCRADGPSCLSTFYGSAKCLYPYSNDPSVRIVTLEMRGQDKQTLFWGPPAELFQVLSLTELEPRLSIISNNALHHWIHILRYTIDISFSIILFNLLPFQPFDGYNILFFSILYFFPEHSDLFRARILRAAHYLSVFILSLFVIVVVSQIKKILI